MLNVTKIAYPCTEWIKPLGRHIGLNTSAQACMYNVNIQLRTDLFQSTWQWANSIHFTSYNFCTRRLNFTHFAAWQLFTRYHHSYYTAQQAWQTSGPTRWDNHSPGHRNLMCSMNSTTLHHCHHLQNWMDEWRHRVASPCRHLRHSAYHWWSRLSLGGPWRTPGAGQSSWGQQGPRLKDVPHHVVYVDDSGHKWSGLLLL